MAQDAPGCEPGRVQRREEQHGVEGTDPRRSAEPAAGRSQDDREENKGNRDQHPDCITTQSVGHHQSDLEKYVEPFLLSDADRKILVEDPEFANNPFFSFRIRVAREKLLGATKEVEVSPSTIRLNHRACDGTQPGSRSRIIWAHAKCEARLFA